MSNWLRVVDPEDISAELRPPVGPEAMEVAARIIAEVRSGGEEAVRRHGERLGDLDGTEALVVDSEQLQGAIDELDGNDRQLLERVASRVRYFAEAQRNSVTDVEVEVPGGRAGHAWLPVGTAGAYAPGGRYPLPSTILMTVIPARVAGVGEVWVASPRPSPLTLAAAGLAGADGLIRAGGAQAIAALALGAVGPRCDIVVGPGNRWVTAAKKLLFGEVGIDGLAGPSEIVVIADQHAETHLVAADLIAQAEHDVEALPILVCTDDELRTEVEVEIGVQMADLPTARVASPAFQRGFAVVVSDLDHAALISDRIAPEHLALHVEDADALAARMSNYGSLFSGRLSAETFADYGVGPNHVLPTGGGARFQSGLSPITFLRSPTWLRLEDPGEVVADTAAFARLERLEGHARAAEARGTRP